MAVTEAMTLDEMLTAAEKYAYKLVGHRNDQDDLIQEARILAWKEYMSDTTKDIKLILSGVKFRIMNLITEKIGSNWTGTLDLGKTGREYGNSRGEASREKIRNYMDSYIALHDHKPSSVEIGKALGMDPSTVRDHQKRMYLFTGPSDFEQVSLDSPVMMNGDPDGNDRSIADHVSYANTFEAELVDKMDTINFLNSVLAERERLFFYLRYFEGYTSQEIGVEQGYSYATVNNTLKSAKSKMKTAKEVTL